MTKRNIKIAWTPLTAKDKESGLVASDFIVSGRATILRRRNLQEFGIQPDPKLLDAMEDYLTSNTVDALDATLEGVTKVVEKAPELPPNAQQPSGQVEIGDLPPERKLAILYRTRGENLPEFESGEKAYITFGPQNKKINIAPDVEPGDIIITQLWKSRVYGEGELGPKGASSFQAVLVPPPLSAVGKAQITFD